MPDRKSQLSPQRNAEMPNRGNEQLSNAHCEEPPKIDRLGQILRIYAAQNQCS